MQFFRGVGSISGDFTRGFKAESVMSVSLSLCVMSELLEHLSVGKGEGEGWFAWMQVTWIREQPMHAYVC